MNRSQIDATIERAYNLLGVNRPREAVDLLTTNNETPTSARALAALAQAYIDLDQPSDAHHAATSAAAQDPNLLSAWSLQSTALVKLGRPELALAPILHAMTLAPNDAYIHARASDVYRRNGDGNRAMAHAQVANELAPDSEYGWDAMCRIYVASEEWANVHFAATNMLQINPESTTGKTFLGLAQTAGAGLTPNAAGMETLISVLRSDPSKQNVRQLLLALAKPRFPIPPLARLAMLISVPFGGGGVIAIVWSAITIGHWLQLPKDVRRLVWSDRSAKIRIVGSLAIAVAIVAAFIAVFVVVGIQAFESSGT